MASWAEALLAEEEVHLSQNAPQSFPECRWCRFRSFLCRSHASWTFGRKGWHGGTSIDGKARRKIINRLWNPVRCRIYH